MDWGLVKAVFILAGRALIWPLKRPKYLIILGVLIGGIVAYQSCNNSPEKQNQEYSVQEQKAPAVKLAPYILQTTSRIYYVTKYTQPSDNQVIMYKWYEWQKNDWVVRYSSEGVMFDREIQGDFRIQQRR